MVKITVRGRSSCVRQTFVGKFSYFLTYEGTYKSSEGHQGAVSS